MESKRRKRSEVIDGILIASEFIIGAIIGGMGKFHDSDALIAMGMIIMIIVGIDAYRKW